MQSRKIGTCDTIRANPQGQISNMFCQINGFRAYIPFEPEARAGS